MLTSPYCLITKLCEYGIVEWKWKDVYKKWNVGDILNENSMEEENIVKNSKHTPICN